MNLESINTPADLVEQNNQNTDVEEAKRLAELFESVLAEGPSYGLVVVKSVLDRLISYHEAGLEETDTPEGTEIWTRDLTKLQIARATVDEVDV